MSIRNRLRRMSAVVTLAVLIALAATGCAGNHPTAPVIAIRKPVLVLGDGGTQDSVLAILKRAGIDARNGGPYWQFDGKGLQNYQSVLFLTGKVYSSQMADSVQQRLIAFVASGGGLMTIEWMGYAQGSDYYPLVAAIIPAKYGSGYAETGETYSVKLAGHPIAAGLPPSFSTPAAAWAYSKMLADPAPDKQATVVIGGSGSGAAVIAGRHTFGRTVHWSQAGHYRGNGIWTTNTRLLLVNIVNYVSGWI
jgi:hypothetical protein